MEKNYTHTHSAMHCSFSIDFESTLDLTVFLEQPASTDPSPMFHADMAAGRFVVHSTTAVSVTKPLSTITLLNLPVILSNSPKSSRKLPT